MADTAPIRRRWLQFGLRTMFVALTLFAIFLGVLAYHVNWIRQRHECLARISARYKSLELNVHFFNINSDTHFPWGLWLLGEEGASQVFPFFDVDVD